MGIIIQICKIFKFNGQNILLIIEKNQCRYMAFNIYVSQKTIPFIINKQKKTVNKYTE